MAESFEADASVVEGMDVFTVKLDDPTVVFDSLLILSQLGEAVGSVVEGLDVGGRPEPYLVPVVLNRLVIPL